MTVSDKSQRGGTFRFSILAVQLVAACVCRTAWGDVRMPAVFSDNMVLQKGVSVPVRGWAAPGE